MKKSLSLIFILWLYICIPSSAQNQALKTNLIYDATLTLNFGGEIAIAPKWTFDLSGNLNAWTFGKARSDTPEQDQPGVTRKRWKHWMLQPEIRYWLCERYQGHFFGAHLIGGEYNIGGIGPFTSIKNHRYQGWGFGGGLAYGHSWIVDKHWNIEAEIGIGYIYSRNDKFRCAGCGKKIDKDRSKNYFGPTKVAINLVYTF